MEGTMAKGMACDTAWEKEWQAEQDCDALCRAAAVKKDPERMKAAKAYAKKKVEENKRRAEDMQNRVDLGEGKDI